jgi:hypothetical protein
MSNRASHSLGNPPVYPSKCLRGFAPKNPWFESRHLWSFIALALALVLFIVVSLKVGDKVGDNVGPKLQELEESSSP